ncbi:glycosyltransferase family 32 protein [Pedobacter metabolipauper]|uniref:Glycosyl transferase-like sugar-binding protein n=1 Tax=Pedobacter metabolipauper TaxID=425513 RepID=A0A4R6SVQ1_9SPHI|nr:glycosyltransferase [Pedobacter metabolipauper]TDQ08441.1 glycosyl transferase-like sugar-binding protein [Pedobacter metabolipauper]
MKKRELTILVSWYDSKDQAEADCFEENMKTFRKHNPECEVVCVKSLLESSSESYSLMDVSLLQWYSANKDSLDAERFLLIDWACWCDVNVKEYYKGVWNADVAGPSVKYPERDSWYWFETIDQLPVQSRLYATGILPFCGILVSERAMDDISSEIWKPDYLNLESELRFATVATMMGFDPVPIPVCSRSLNWNENLPFDGRHPGLHYPRKRMVHEDCLRSIDQHFNNPAEDMPKIFHQTWKTVHIPEHYEKAVHSWKVMHPDWEFILWTDEMNRVFIKTFFPDFLLIYDSYPHNIQRVDAVRYFILYQLGGVFVDLDFECLENIEPLIADYKCSFGLEPPAHADQKSMDFLICNAFMASYKSNDFFRKILDKLYLFEVSRGNYFFDVLASTGPTFLSLTYAEYAHKDEVNLISSEKLYPLTASEAERLVDNDMDDVMILKMENAYAVHYFSGNWLAG